MASKRYDALSTQGLQRVRIGGSFRPAGTGAVTNVVGKGFTVARTDVGKYTITFTDTFFALDECEASVRTSDASYGSATFGAYVAASKTLVLQVFKLSVGVPTATDLSADADNVVNFSCVFRNTGVGY